jgi:hypothetical protein
VKVKNFVLFFPGFYFTSKPFFLRMGEASRGVSKLLVLRFVVGNMIRFWSPAPNHLGIIPTLLTSDCITLSRIQLNRQNRLNLINQSVGPIPQISTYHAAVADSKGDAVPASWQGLWAG